jgi:hypothetical protein
MYSLGQLESEIQDLQMQQKRLRSGKSAKKLSARSFTNKSISRENSVKSMTTSAQEQSFTSPTSPKAADSVGPAAPKALVAVRMGSLRWVALQDS